LAGWLDGALALLSTVAVVPAVSLVRHSVTVRPIMATEVLPSGLGRAFMVAYAPERFNHRYLPVRSGDLPADTQLIFRTSVLRHAER
jgi:hypothetical protein